MYIFLGYYNVQDNFFTDVSEDYVASVRKVDEFSSDG
jgi:hypothetical protein